MYASLMHVLKFLKYTCRGAVDYKIDLIILINHIPSDGKKVQKLYQ